MRTSPRSVPPVDQCPTEIFRSCRALSRRLAALSCTAAIAAAFGLGNKGEPRGIPKRGRVHTYQPQGSPGVTDGEPITPFRTANSPTETFRIWPHRIRLRLPPPVRFPAREVRSAGVFRSLRQEDGARETGWLGELDSNRRDAVDLAREARSAGVFRNLRKKT